MVIAGLTNPYKGALAPGRTMSMDGQLELRRTLTQLSALGALNVDKFDEHGQAPLHRAARVGDAEGVRVLIAAGADVHSRDQRTRGAKYTPFLPPHTTALHHAALACSRKAAINEGKVHCVTILVDAGADVNSCDTKGCTPLHVAVNYRDSEGADLVAALVSKGAAIDREADGGMSGVMAGTPLMCAAEIGNLACVAMLIRLGADVDHEDSSQGTPLLCAVSGDHPTCVEALVAAGANLHPATTESPLTHAAKFGSADCMAALVKQVDVDVDREDKDGKSPFYWAMVGPNDPNAPDFEEDYYDRGCRRCIGILFEAGAEYSKPAAWSSTLKQETFFEYFEDRAHAQAMEYMRKIAKKGSYDALVRDHRRVLAALIQNALESRFRRFAPRVVAEHILHFWMPPGGW